jgi:hypothetical protein
MESTILQEMRQTESHFHMFEVSTAVKIKVFWHTTLCPWVRVSDVSNERPSKRRETQKTSNTASQPGRYDYPFKAIRSWKADQGPA